ncbi:hypothetical protein K470DRAFT_268085 [Piedraia hortae CBS 480.64]|uniref:Uncharacterized protein n=1 Tax=Piedraia hortae CBS 480.64 TaxID=1314780 RepID=A0A6A7C9C0_9PEZI|nr:hypothetical protein K470DRAFT_268085 [Piedraia hortae CBS 480.64]
MSTNPLPCAALLTDIGRIRSAEHQIAIPLAVSIVDGELPWRGTAYIDTIDLFPAHVAQLCSPAIINFGCSASILSEGSDDTTVPVQLEWETSDLMPAPAAAFWAACKTPLAPLSGLEPQNLNINWRERIPHLPRWGITPGWDTPWGYVVGETDRMPFECRLYSDGTYVLARTATLVNVRPTGEGRFAVQVEIVIHPEWTLVLVGFVHPECHLAVLNVHGLMLR